MPSIRKEGKAAAAPHLGLCLPAPLDMDRRARESTRVPSPHLGCGLDCLLLNLRKPLQPAESTKKTSSYITQVSPGPQTV